jgi:cephalosporin hydroxylase
VLSRSSLTSILYSIATGYTDRAVELLTTSDEISDDERELLTCAVVADGGCWAQARGLGDALRSVGAERHLSNECYRVAFYASDDWKVLSLNPLYAFFTANRGGNPLDKWIHYFEIYDRHLASYRGRPVRVLEIGVYRGGGLEMLRNYLGPAAKLVGIDIDEVALAAARGYKVELGDQADPEFLRFVSEKHGPFDVVIDDGGHTMRQQIASAEALFPLLNEGGTYLVEDCHTSYWPAYADQGPDGLTFMEWVKERIDDLNAYHHSQVKDFDSPWQTHLDGLNIYDSIVVFNKRRRAAPFSELTGTKEFINYDRDTGALHLELLATRDAAVARVAKADADIARVADIESEAAARIAAAESEAAARIAAAESEVVYAEALSSSLLADLEDLVEADSQEFEELHSDLLQVSSEYSRTHSDLLGAWQIIRELRHSTSWKVTEPLRRGKSILTRRR